MYTAHTHLWRLLKHGAKTSKPLGSSEITKDVAEEFLRVHVRAPSPELLLTAAALAWATGRAISVILPPLHIITQHLEGEIAIMSSTFLINNNNNNNNNNKSGSCCYLPHMLLHIWQTSLSLRDHLDWYPDGTSLPSKREQHW